MKLEELIIDKEYITNDGARAFYRGCNSYGQPIFEVSVGQNPHFGVNLIVGNPETNIASGRYWCYSELESEFEEITDKNE